MVFLMFLRVYVTRYPKSIIMGAFRLGRCLNDTTFTGNTIENDAHEGGDSSSIFNILDTILFRLIFSSLHFTSDNGGGIRASVPHIEQVLPCLSC